MKCPACGALAPDAHVFCTSCGARLASPMPPASLPPSPPVPPPAAPTVSLAARQSPPVASADASAVPVAAVVAAPQASAGPVYASLGTRALGALLDLFALAACFWVAGSLAASRFGGWTAEGGFIIEGGPALLAIFASMAAWLAYCLCWEWLLGGTFGKWAAGIRVMRSDGRRPSLFVRNGLRLVDGIGVYMLGAIFVFFTKKRQRLGDLMAGTVVTRRPPNPTARAAALFASLALPVLAFGATWYLGLPQAASGRRMSGGTTSLHAEGSYTAGVSAVVGDKRKEVHVIDEGTAAGRIVHESLTMDSLRFAVGRHGPERPGGAFRPGETAALLFDLSGMASQGSAMGRTRMKVRVLDPNGVDVVQPIEHADEVPVGSKPVPSYVQFDLPEYCLPGQHRLDMLVEDLVAGRQVKASVPFTVNAAPYEPSGKLTFRSLHLTEGKDGPPRANASYPAGGTVWLALQVVGFKGGNEGTVKVAMDVSVTRTGGASVGDLPLLTVDQRFFYVPRRIPMTANLTLGKMPPGAYLATVRAYDEIGQQRTEQQLAFTIVQ
jgi:uncharacterized RDD family membrane protein YckC